jgi:hypothetical protein
MKPAIIAVLLTAALFATAPAQEAFVGETLISSRTSNESYLMAMDFSVVKSWHGSTPPAAFAYMLEDSSILRPSADVTATWGIGGSGGRIQIIDTNDVIVWDYFVSDSLKLQHHDVEPMPNGNVLVIAWERKFQAEAIAAGRVSIPIGEIWPTLILELEPVGLTGANVVWEWHLWDHFIQDADPTKANYDVVGDHPELVDINWPVAANGSFDHANAIGYNPQLDLVVFSARAMSEIYVIDHSTTTAEAAGHTGGFHGKGGDIVYRWGNPEVYRRGTPSDHYYYSVHGANWIAPGLPGAGGILTFNNGNRPGAANDYSSVEDIHPPMDVNGHFVIAPGQPYGPAAPSWSYEDRGVFYSMNKGGAFRMPNGNTLICESNDNQLFEVTEAGVKVWAFPTPGELHRAPRYWDEATAVAPPAEGGPDLHPSYPNPFNPSTTIAFELKAPGRVTLEVFDVGGRHVVTLVDEELVAGRHDVPWQGRDKNGRAVVSGVYLYRLSTPGFARNGKMVLTK